MTALSNSLDLHALKYEKILILGNFNAEIEEANMKSFSEKFKKFDKTTNLPTCYKIPNKSTGIDLILINVPLIFQSTCIIET